MVDTISTGLSAPTSSGLGIATATLSPVASYEIGQYFKSKDAEGSTAHILAHTVLGAAVAAAGGNDALTAGLSAGGAEAAAPKLAQYLYGKDAKDLTADEKSTISAITGLVASGVGATTGDVSSTVQSGQVVQNAVEDNKTSYWQDIKHLGCWSDECVAAYNKMDAAQDAAFRKGQDQAISKFVNDIKNLPNVPQELYEAVKNDPKGVAKAIYEGIKNIPGELWDTTKTITAVNTLGSTPAEFERLGNAEMTTALNGLSAALSAGAITVVKKGGTVTIEAVKDIKRVLQNDPAKLPLVKTSTSGNISAKQITENGKIIDPPKEVLNKQQQLLNNTDNNKSGILREEIADSYFKNSGYTKLESKCGSNCFDGVYMKNGELYIVEVKPLKERGSVKLSDNKKSTNDIGVQMSDKWIVSRTEALVKTKNPDAIKTATLITKAVNEGKPINKIVVGVNDSRAITLNLGNKVTK
ncbi:hemagglutinin [Acinetobacter bereziniae]|nr:VENN motif pre-toxin domain-containing protein [Acinetobacter bereziniae]ATZ64503.1 hemagglutinin [Acinetobacter bereziniae]